MSSPDRRKVALVTTTIHVPHCLDNYLANAERHGHAERTSVIVVGDRKTPPATGEYLAALGRRYPGSITYLDDDNFVTGDDYIGHHLAVGQRLRVPVVHHPSGWWNVCQRLKSEPPRRFY